MPDIGSLHPQVVHFVIALLIVGVLARILSLFPLGPRWSFLNGMAVVLILLGTGASVVAVQSGLDAHEKVESIPGVRQAVNVHQDYGEDTRDIFLVVSAIEIVMLFAATRKPGLTTGLRALSAVVGIVGGVYLYEAGDHGGDLVYAYGGGVGVRSGDTTDVRRVLVAGLYDNLQVARRTGNHEQAARLTDQLQSMLPNDTSVRMLRIQSLVRDRNDARGALAALDSITVQPANQRLRYQKALLQAEAFDSAGMRDSARAVLTQLKKDVPQAARRVDAMLRQMR
ncbi:MAG TPA: DUF2231 domain-containing protein [Gemmatimonadaceae bacterium]|nr:DUF2231 domain-containing protein [Gemmatimonadaceae bacterium]